MTHAWNSYNGPAVITGAWTTGCKTKDLSSIVGAQSVVAFFEIQGTFGSYAGYSIKPFGDVDSYFDVLSPSGAKGMCSVESQSGKSGGILALTDSNGKVEYCGENKSANAFLLGWFVPTSATKLDVFAGVMPIAWTSRSLPSGPDPNKDTLLFLKYKSTANTDYIAIREDGSTEDFLPTQLPLMGGASMGGDAANNVAIGLIGCYEASNGPYEHICDNSRGGPATVDCDLLSYEQDNFRYHNHLIYSTTDDSGVDVDIDLSAYTGIAYALAILKIENTGAATTLVLAASPRNSSQSWKATTTGSGGSGCCQVAIDQDEFAIIVVPTDLAGHIEVEFTNVGAATTKITLVGSISEEEIGPPVVTEPYPSGNFVSVNNPEKISFVVSNFYGVVKNTISLKARDPIGKETQIILNGAFQGDFSGFIAEVGVIVEGNNNKIYVQVDEFDELLLTREWKFIVDAENSIGVPI
jgi:hypothetical protein